MKYLLVCFLLLCPLLALAADVTLDQHTKFLTEAKADLNGDTTEEAIRLTVLKEAGYRLQIGAASTTWTPPKEDIFDEAQGVVVLDLNTQDRQKEVVVRLADANAITYHLYGFDGTRLLNEGVLYNEVTIPGNGIIYQRTWAEFWIRTDKYLFNGTAHRLELVAQPFYAVDVRGTVKVSVPIYAERDAKKAVVAHLLPKSTVTFLLNTGDWYLLQTSTHLTGWIHAKEIIPEHFDGLTWGA